MKVLTMMIGIFFLLGCSPSVNNATASTETVKIKCLGGVKYYLFKENMLGTYQGYGYMAPAYNKTSKQVELC